MFVLDEYIRYFKILIKARDQAVEAIREAVKTRKIIRGWEVDDITRGVISNEGLDTFYLHRTGHTLSSSFFAYGVNLDNLETRDDRPIIPGLCLSIGPGIFFSDYGLKTEINVYTDKKGIHLSTSSVQKEIYQIVI